MSDRIVQALVNIKNHDTLVVIGHTAKPHSGADLPKGTELAHALEDIETGRRGRVRIAPRKLANS